MQGDESPVSVTYQVNGFDEVLEVVAQLTEQGIVPITAAKQVESLKETFLQLQTMFILVSVFIVVIALTISGMLLMKLARMRSGEIGLLMALGYHRGQIQKMLLWESLLLSSLSALTTTLFALPVRDSSGSYCPASVCWEHLRNRPSGMVYYCHSQRKITANRPCKSVEGMSDIKEETQ